MSRRSLVARAGLAGLAGALLLERQALAAPEDDTERPNIPTDADIALLGAVIGFELAASELYRIKLAAGAGSNDLAAAVGVMAESHQAYAQAIAGDTGLSAADADAGLVDELRSGFEGSDADFFAAAHGLEQTAVATHTAAISTYESTDAIALTASILVVEARHATVLADLLGVDDLDVIFGNEQSALALGDDA